ncbi:MAG: type II toxin-antitoxin system death-on-curing family toxin [Acidobacteriaceae bacterium]
MAVDEVRALHGIQLAAFGGPEGLRDEGLLESALARPKHAFVYETPVPSLARLAAAYAFGIVKNHPFVDGNKRTGLVAAFAFLELNGAALKASEEDAYEVFMSLAAGRLSEANLAVWLEENS